MTRTTSAFLDYVLLVLTGALFFMATKVVVFEGPEDDGVRPLRTIRPHRQMAGPTPPPNTLPKVKYNGEMVDADIPPTRELKYSAPTPPTPPAPEPPPAPVRRQPVAPTRPDMGQAGMRRMVKSELTCADLPVLPAVMPKVLGERDGKIVYELMFHQIPDPRFSGWVDREIELGADGSGFVYWRDNTGRRLPVTEPPPPPQYWTFRQICMMYVSALDAIQRATKITPDPTWDDPEGR